MKYNLRPRNVKFSNYISTRNSKYPRTEFHRIKEIEIFWENSIKNSTNITKGAKNVQPVQNPKGIELQRQLKKLINHPVTQKTKESIIADQHEVILQGQNKPLTGLFRQRQDGSVIHEVW